MEFEDDNNVIFLTFYEKWCKDGRIWEDFIISKNLGIVYVYTKYRENMYHTYRIIDEKKWALNKIKYGI